MKKLNATLALRNFARLLFTGTPGQVLSFVSSGVLGWVTPTTATTGSTTVQSETSFGQASSAGTGTTYSRGNHTHGTPTDPVPAHVAASDPHGDRAYAAAQDAAHVAAADPHTQYALETDLPVNWMAATRSGYWYQGGRLSYNTTADSAGTAPADTWRLLPILISGKACTIDALGIRVSTAVAGSKALLAVYEDSSGYPGALVGSTVINTTSAAFLKTTGLALSLAANKRYWIGLLNSNGGSGFWRYSPNDAMAMYFAEGDSAPSIGYSLAQAYSDTPPNPFTAGGVDLKPASHCFGTYYRIA